MADGSIYCVSFDSFYTSSTSDTHVRAHLPTTWSDNGVVLKWVTRFTSQWKNSDGRVKSSFNHRIDSETQLTLAKPSFRLQLCCSSEIHQHQAIDRQHRWEEMYWYIKHFFFFIYFHWCHSRPSALLFFVGKETLWKSSSMHYILLERTQKIFYPKWNLYSFII